MPLIEGLKSFWRRTPEGGGKPSESEQMEEVTPKAAGAAVADKPEIVEKQPEKQEETKPEVKPDGTINSDDPDLRRLAIGTAAELAMAGVARSERGRASVTSRCAVSCNSNSVACTIGMRWKR